MSKDCILENNNSGQLECLWMWSLYPVVKVRDCHLTRRPVLPRSPVLKCPKEENLLIRHQTLQLEQKEEDLHNIIYIISI